ncbi:MFS transporter [Reyranella sp.]|uniref:MFS transporter n=1 Tax=Reyranella sp. TaxID=1929291 RepID=UPI0025DC858E|nr:MFS transporter [Reyranella sp.]
MSLTPATDTSPAAWRVVFACFVTAVFAWGFGFYAHGIYLVELQRARGWSTGFISSVVTAHYLLGALLLPRIAEAIARFGPRTVFLAGLATSAAALMLLPSVTEPWQLVVLYIAMAPGWNATSVAPIAATVGQWFDRKRGLALNLALSGATVAGLAVTPVLLASIPALGFAMAERLLVAIGIVLAAGTVVLFVRRGPLSPKLTAARPDRLAPLRQWHFWSIAAPFAIVLTSQVGFLTHLVPLVTSRAAASGLAIDPALAVGINAVTALAGRVVLGLVIDRFEPRRASAVCFLVQAGAIAVLQFVETPLAVYGACAAYGLAVGNIITLSPMIVQREFTPDRFPAIVALSTAIMQTLYAFGPGLLGVLRDASGGYGVPLAVCMGLNLTASALILMRPRTGTSAR